MGRVRVEHGEARSRLQGARLDQPMRWAVSKSTGAAIYVGMLEGGQNGDACGCKCPACGEDLQAVNVDKDVSHFQKANTRGKFFRHPSGHHRKDCSFLTAKLAALQLLMECDKVDLPPPRRPWAHVGVSGATYTDSAVGQVWSGHITEKVWLDSQSARITIDGRTVLIQLEARPTFSSDVKLDGVITIRVDDPVVASWAPSEILQALQLDSGFSCWEKHWDDEELEAEARRKAEEAADEALDRVPLELGSLEGLTCLQKSETILHAKVKEILASAGRLVVPADETNVTRLMLDGRRKTIPVRIESQTLLLSRVRLEAPWGGMVPDVVCNARASRNPTDGLLMIEVAVTHRVDATKKASIESAKLACIEIDLTLLGGIQRRITVEQLRTAVIEDERCKRWVYNPWLARLVESERQELEREDQEKRLLAQHEEERENWLDKLSTERLTELLMPALKHYWQTGLPMSADDEYHVLPQEIAARLSRRGFKDADNHLLLTKGGLLDCLDNIRAGRLAGRLEETEGGLWRLEKDAALQRYVTLGLIVIKAYTLRLSIEDKARVQALREKVARSLKQLDRRYARPSFHDALIDRLFPATHEFLSHPTGTLKALDAQIQLSKDKQRLLSDQRARVEADTEAAAQRKAQLVHEKSLREMQERTQKNELIYEVLSSENVSTWSSDMSTTSIEAVLSQSGVRRLGAKYDRSNLSVEKLLKEAWKARARGHSLRAWLNEQSPKDTTTGKMMIEALRTAGFVT